MIILRKIFPFSLLLLTACSPITLHMNVDSALEKNSDAYPIIFDTGWSQDYKDFNFGSYHVKKSTNLKTTVLSKETTSPTLFDYFILDEQEVSNSRIAKSHSYEFEQDTKMPWKAYCMLVVDQREKKYTNFSITDYYSSQYACTYTRENSAPWYLSIKGYDTENRAIEMTNQKLHYTAILTSGNWFKTDGSKAKVGFDVYAGYTWVSDKTKIAAISSQEQFPKIWLNKKNNEELNSIISMASAGLLLYEYMVLPTE